MQKKIYVKGMHCASCELLVSQAIEEIDGAKVLSISARKGEVLVEYPSSSAEKQIEYAIKDSGYQIFDPQKNYTTAHSKFNKITQFITAIIIVGILVWIFNSLDLTKYLSTLGSSTSLPVILIIGLVASLSTCSAIVGGVIIGINQQLVVAGSMQKVWSQQALFQLGRLLGFFALGGMLGWIGKYVSVGLGTKNIFLLAIGVLLVYIGVQMFGLLPQISFPKSRGKNILNNQKTFLPILGALTFFLPCGFTQAMQLVAIGSGSFLSGGLIMMAFAIGTLPVLYLLGIGSSYAQAKKYYIINMVVALLLIVFGLFTISNSWKLLGAKSSIQAQQIVQETTGQNITDTQTTPVAEAKEVIEVSHDGMGLVPMEVDLQANKAYTLNITPTSNGLGCFQELMIPDISEEAYPIIKGQTITYEISGLSKGTYPVVCAAMGMSMGALIVK